MVYGTIPLLDPPGDGPLTAIVGAIYRFSLGPPPLAIARQASPEVPAVEEQEPQAIADSGLCARSRRWRACVA